MCKLKVPMICLQTSRVGQENEIGHIRLFGIEFTCLEPTIFLHLLPFVQINIHEFCWKYYLVSKSVGKRSRGDCSRTSRQWNAEQSHCWAGVGVSALNRPPSPPHADRQVCTHMCIHAHTYMMSQSHCIAAGGITRMTTKEG